MMRTTKEIKILRTQTKSTHSVTPTYKVAPDAIGRSLSRVRTSQIKVLNRRMLKFVSPNSNLREERMSSHLRKLSDKFCLNSES